MEKELIYDKHAGVLGHAVYEDPVEKLIKEANKSKIKIDFKHEPYLLKGCEIGEIVQVKNEQYGDAINNTAEFLKLLFPQGIPVGDYQSVGTLVRVYDKLKRIANGNKGEENAWQDIAGYGILMSVKKDE